jgi:hypothetical protein
MTEVVVVIGPGSIGQAIARRVSASKHVVLESSSWAKRGARINTISPGIIITPLAVDELTGPRGDGYRRMIDLSPAEPPAPPTRSPPSPPSSRDPTAASSPAPTSSSTAASPPPNSTVSSRHSNNTNSYPSDHERSC